MTLLSLLITTLTDDAIEHVISCKTTQEAWSNLEEIYASVFKTGIDHLKKNCIRLKNEGFNG